MKLVEPLPKDISICRPYVANWGEQLRWAIKQGGSQRKGYSSQHPCQLTADQVVAASVTNNNSNQNNDQRGQDFWSTKRPQSGTDLKLSKTKTDDKSILTPSHCYKCGKIGYVHLEYCSKSLEKAQGQ